MKMNAAARNMVATAKRDEALREANRIHCRQTRERKREQERLLREELDLLQLCRDIAESGPDVFSVHGLNPNAPFRFLSESFCRMLQIDPEDILGQPLSSIVDPRDAAALRNLVLQVLGGGSGGGGGRGGEAPPLATSSSGACSVGPFSPSWPETTSTAIDPDFGDTAVAMYHKHQQPAVQATRGISAGPNGGGGREGVGGLVNVRLSGFGVSCHAGMSIAIGVEGLIVVTRPYLPELAPTTLTSEKAILNNV